MFQNLSVVAHLRGVEKLDLHPRQNDSMAALSSIADSADRGQQPPASHVRAETPRGEPACRDRRAKLLSHCSFGS